MHLRDALDDYKRYHGDGRPFVGERRTTTGRFSGLDGRLVHVAPDGSLRDFSYPLTGLNGIERSRLGLRVDGETHWFDAEGSTQSYHGSTGLVVTEHDGVVPATQYDLTLDDGHVTHVEAPDAAELVVYVAFGPDRQETQISQLHHADAVETYHDREHDFFAGAPGFATLSGEPQIDFASILADEPVEEPRSEPGDRYDEDRLSGEIVASVPLDDGTATVASLTTDRTETTREAALDRVHGLVEDYGSVAALEQAAESQPNHATDDLPAAIRDAVAVDLRSLAFLEGATGLRMAGPDFDPFFAHSGGYGYTWFRDDAEISRFLLDADDAFDLDLDGWHERSARAYCTAQLADGTWPHRVWPRSGALAPGWANGRLEAGSDVDYQADQTGSVIGFLAAYREKAPADLHAAIDETLAAALDGLDATLADDGRPVACQNAWEDMTGRFTHTAATFLEAYAELAATTTADVDSDRAREGAQRVYDALDDLWCPDREIYALREHDGEIDDRYDSATFALPDAHRAFDRIERVDDERLDRLVAHVENVCDGLWRGTDEITGLVRYEGDDWRQGEQGREKVWTVSTAWGAYATASLAALLDAHDDPRSDEFAARSRELLAAISPDGALTMETGYLPEQLFDDGTPDSATPLGWPHAIRTATLALYEETDAVQDAHAALAASQD